MEWFSNTEKEKGKKVEPIPQTMKLVFDFASVLEKLGVSRREVSYGTGIRFGTINDYCNGTYRNINPDNLAHAIEYLSKNYGVEWTDIIKFEPMTPEEIEQKAEEKENRKPKAPRGMYAKYGRYVSGVKDQENEEDEQTTE